MTKDERTLLIMVAEGCLRMAQPFLEPKVSVQELVAALDRVKTYSTPLSDDTRAKLAKFIETKFYAISYGGVRVDWNAVADELIKFIVETQK